MPDKNKMVDALKIRGRMAELRIDQREMARMLEMSTVTFNSRMKDLRNWRSEEILNASRILNIPDERVFEYFFDY
jgi:hypothetical protein